MGFTTTDKVKLALGVPAGTTYHDVKLDYIVDGVNQAVADFCGRDLALATYTEIHSPDFVSNTVLLDHWPVLSIVALTNSGAAVSALDYICDAASGEVQLKSGTWGVGPGAVEVTLYAGIDESDLTLERAATMWAASRANRSPNIGFRSETMQRYRYELVDDDMPMETARALARYRRAFV